MEKGLFPRGNGAFPRGIPVFLKVLPLFSEKGRVRCSALLSLDQLGLPGGEAVMGLRILFVDDEKRILEGLKRMLRPFRKEWSLSFAQDGREALEILEEESFDVIVSDMRMPGIDGAELLSTVREKYPNMVRIILSGQSDQEKIIRSVGPSHQFLSKPSNPEEIRKTIQAIRVFKELFKDESLKKIVGGMTSLPSLPSLYTEVMEKVNSPTASLADVGEAIAKDPGMTAQILKLVNSAYFGLSQEVTSPAVAVNLLGLNTVTSLILTVQVFKELSPELMSRFKLDLLWDKSLLLAKVARAIAMEETGEKKAADEAYTAGLLADCGKVILASGFPDRFARVVEDSGGDCLWAVEEEEKVFGVSHGPVGGYLMELWGLPGPVVAAIAFHHHPSLARQEEFSALAAVHAAACLERSVARGEEDLVPAELDTAFLEKLGLEKKVAAWREMVREQVEACMEGAR